MEKDMNIITNTYIFAGGYLNGKKDGNCIVCDDLENLAFKGMYSNGEKNGKGS